MSVGGGKPFRSADICRAADGSVDEGRERSRIEILQEELPTKEVGRGSGRRELPWRASFNAAAGEKPKGESGRPAAVEQAEERLRALREEKEREHPKAWKLDHDEMAKMLDGYPSALEASLLLDMIRNGASRGYEGPRDKMVIEPRAAKEIQEDERAKAEGRTATLSEKQEAVAKATDKEIQLGNLVGQFQEPPFSNSIICSAAAIPKKVEGEVVEGKKRVIVGPTHVNEHTPQVWTPTPR
jgi:hypothetical protein